MRVRVLPGSRVADHDQVHVPGDKSIAHRWLILAMTARGRSRLRNVSRSLDLRSTATCLRGLTPVPQPALDRWMASAAAHDQLEVGRQVKDEAGATRELTLDGSGRAALREPDDVLDCGNSGTTMRLLAGVVAGSAFPSVLTGDASLRSRPMERVAAPLRAMGAVVETVGGRPPIAVRGGPLRGIRHVPAVPSAQVKGAVLLAGLVADGETTVVESVPTRDHTERSLEALGIEVRATGRIEDYVAGPRRSDFHREVVIAPSQHAGFEAAVPGDPSASALLCAAAAVTGGSVMVSDVGLNPTRTRFLAVLARMGVEVEAAVDGASMGEPFGALRADGGDDVLGTRIDRWELPLVIDEVPALAAIAAHGSGETRFEGAGELRVKESDRLTGLGEGLRGLGGNVVVEGDALVVAGGGLRGGRADARGDHRLAMALVCSALGARGVCEIEGIEWAAVSFPGFVPLLASLGARIEVVG
jgi:3-phosphoshikimate 1-carboxyvinyltransferase